MGCSQKSDSMSSKEIEDYLSGKHIPLDNNIRNEIEKLHQNAISNRLEDEANYFWCLMQIYRIQNGYISAINSLKNKQYEDAWCLFDQADVELSYLEANFDTTQNTDKYHMVFIGRMIKEYQKLFPYCYFFSRECVIKAEECSICGKPISLRNPCGHKVGKLYMGKLCLRKVVDMEYKAISIVTDPFDKYTYIKLPDQEYEYGMLETLMVEIDNPYDEFHVETVKVLKPKYRDVSRNAPCPCGSGKKYKKCHLGKKDELMDHYSVHISKPNLRNKSRFVGTFGTWK